MQAFVHLTLFTLLFVISVAINPTLTVITGNTKTAPTTPTPPAGASDSAATSSTLTTPTGASDSAATSSTPTTPAGASDSTATSSTPTTPEGASDSTATSSTPTTPTGADTSTPTPATLTTAGADTSTPVPASTTAPTDLCQDDSCAGGSYCVNLNNTHFCQCIHGYYYNSSSCTKGKVFPGIIQVKVSDTSGLENEMSINYENLYMEVNNFFKDVFANTSDYGQTVIQRVSTRPPAGSQMRAGDKVVYVVVVNIFAEDTKENETTISDKIRDAISSGPNIANYTNVDRCEFYGCVKEDDCSDGFQCKCQAGYERPKPYTTTCLPLTERCPYACDSKPNTQCLVKDDGSPDCVCLAGYKKDNHEKCQVCAFGYSGVNCGDNFQLILTVLGTTAGILILGLVIALIFMRSKKTKDIEQQNLIENDFQNLKLQQRIDFSFPAEGSIFPKISTSFPRDIRMQNPYENPRGIPRPDY